jgi:hypothetical protein
MFFVFTFIVYFLTQPDSLICIAQKAAQLALTDAAHRERGISTSYDGPGGRC